MPNSNGFQVNEVLTAANTNTYLMRPFRNCVINGAMNVTQRGTTLAGITSGDVIGTADRWFLGLSGAGTWTQSVQALTSSDPPLQDGVRNSFKVLCTTANASPAAGAYAIIGQKIEGYNMQQFAKGTLNAKSFALSFWVKAAKTGTHIVELYDNDNNRTISAAYTISIAGQWQKVRLIFAGDVTGMFDNDNNFSLALYFWIVAGSNYTSGSLQTAWGTLTSNKRAVGQVNEADAVNNYVEITGVQLEPNSVCTPFEVRDYGTELALCQRYFFKITGTSQYEPVCAAGVNSSASAHARTTCVTPVPMRKALATADMAWNVLIAYDGAGIVFVTIGTIVGHTIGSTMVSIDWNSAGSLTTGRPVVILTQPGSSTYYFQLNAEL